MLRTDWLINKTYFDLLSGRDARGAITEQNLIASWSPAGAALTYTANNDQTIGGAYFRE